MFAVDTTEPPRWVEEQPMAWSHSGDLPDAFFPAVVAMCDRLGCAPVDMVSCWMSESDVSPKAHNPGGNAVGLFQAMPATLMGLGYTGTWLDFSHLSAVQQLSWAERYYAHHKGRLVSPGACYLATFLPALMGHAADPFFVLCSRTIHPEWYTPNKLAFDPGNSGSITVGALTDRIARVTVGPRWDEIYTRLRAAVPIDDAPDVATTRGQQCAYNRLGYPCSIDGQEGPETRGACRAFQGDHNLITDGVCGPLTQVALEIALSTVG